MLDKLILGGLALVCLMITVAGLPALPSPIDEYSRDLETLKRLLDNTEERVLPVEKEKLNNVKRGLWYKYRAKYDLKAEQRGDIPLQKGETVYLELDKLPEQPKWTEGIVVMLGAFYFSGQVPTNYLEATSESSTGYSKPKDVIKITLYQDSFNL